MKTVRKRKILNMMKHNSKILMCEYYHHESAMVVAGVRTITEKREISILNTLSEYDHILNRNFPLHTGIYEDEWVLLVSEFY